MKRFLGVFLACVTLCAGFALAEQTSSLLECPNCGDHPPLSLSYGNEAECGWKCPNNCGYSVTVPHDRSGWPCNDANWHCDQCGNHYPGTKHSYEIRSNGDGTHTPVCSGCGAKLASSSCGGGTATCTKPAVCDTCGAEYGSPLGHDFSSGVYLHNGDGTHSQKCARCEATDSVRVRCSGGAASCQYPANCTVCGQAYGEALGHLFEATKTVEVTCEQDGYTEYACARCGMTYRANIVGKKLHLFGEWTPLGDGRHEAACTREDCGAVYATACEPLTLWDGSLSVCPVCGEVRALAGEDEPLRLTPVAEARFVGRIEQGSPMAMLGALPDGRLLVTVAVEYAGAAAAQHNPVRVWIPLEDETLTPCNGLDGSALEYRYEDGRLSFQFTGPTVCLLSPHTM